MGLLRLPVPGRRVAATALADAGAATANSAGDPATVSASIEARGSPRPAAVRTAAPAPVAAASHAAASSRRAATATGNAAAIASVGASAV